MVSRQEQSLMRAARAARAAALRATRRVMKVGKEMGKAAARELEAAGTTARAGQKRWSRRESVARAIIPTQRVEQWQKPSLQACSRLARHVLLLPVSSDSLASATTRTNAHTGAWCHAVARASRLGACLQAACRADESGMRRHMPHLQASMAFMSKAQA